MLAFLKPSSQLFIPRFNLQPVVYDGPVPDHTSISCGVWEAAGLWREQKNPFGQTEFLSYRYQNVSL